MAQTISCGPGRRTGRRRSPLAGVGRIGTEQVHGRAEPRHDRFLNLDVAGEHDQRLSRCEEVVDPGERGGELAPGRESLQQAELGQALGT